MAGFSVLESINSNMKDKSAEDLADPPTRGGCYSSSVTILWESKAEVCAFNVMP